MTANPTPLADAARVRIEGTVTAVHADGRFTLALPDGSERAGTATGSQLRRLGKFLTSEVLILGVATPDGLLVADGVLPVKGPFILGKGDTPLSASESAEAAARFRSILGKWPGDETDEQIDALLKNDR
jgi:hypothetical protein